MKFTLSWLRDHLETGATVEAITHTLTMIGLEVEHVENKAKALAPFTIARVISRRAASQCGPVAALHGRYRSGEPVQVVCGAPNARTGMTSVFSPPGTFIPGKNLTLAVGTIRGVESRGMLCSGFELQLSDDHDGIFGPAARRAGRGALHGLGATRQPGDRINLTPNRPDCTGVHGIARDLAAADMGTSRTPRSQPIRARSRARSASGSNSVPRRRCVRALRCGWCAASRMAVSRNGCSSRLTAIGLRPINALVDITNYITYDRGRPLTCSTPPRSKGDWSWPRPAGREPAGARRRPTRSTTTIA